MCLELGRSLFLWCDCSLSSALWLGDWWAGRLFDVMRPEVSEDRTVGDGSLQKVIVADEVGCRKMRALFIMEMMGPRSQEIYISEAWYVNYGTTWAVWKQIEGSDLVVTDWQ